MSPVVYDDIFSRIGAVAAAQSMNDRVAWPNQDFKKPGPGTSWLNVEFVTTADTAIELGLGTWLEQGSVWLHFMLAKKTNIRAGLVLAEQFCLAFRDAQDTPPGLVYRAQSMDPLDQAEDGVFNRLTATVRYDFQNRKV